MKNVKKLLFIEAIVLLLAILMFAQTTFAYFSSRTKTTATITAGDVAIVLSEAAVKRDASGHLIEDKEKTRIFGTSDGAIHDYGVVFPGQKIFKDPTIMNTGTNDAYIAAKMTISDGVGDIHRVIGYADYKEIDLEMMFGGGFLDRLGETTFGDWHGIEAVSYNDDFAIAQIPKPEENKYDIYFFILKPSKHGESIKLFTEMFFSGEFNNEQMKEFAELRVDIHAFAVQTFGFESCYEAMLGALPDHFEDFVQSAP